MALVILAPFQARITMRHGFRLAVSSSITEGRQRLGSKPLEWLFVRTASHWAHPSADRYRWRELAVYGVDGTSLRLPDSDENRAHFGGQRSKRGDSGYPQIALGGPD